MKWEHNFIQDKISGLHETLHHTGLSSVRCKTMKIEDITNGIADLYSDINFKKVKG